MNLSVLFPEITLFCGALVILMSDVFFGKKIKDFFYFSHFLCLIFCAIAVFFLVSNPVNNNLIFNQMFLSNSFTFFAKAIVVMLLTIIVLFSLRFVYFMQKISAEFLALLMIATVGGMLLISAHDFLVFYLSLELQALSLYLLAALKRESVKSGEAGIKYFILGCLASGILLFGISMIYGFSGTTNFKALNDLYHGLDASKAGIPAGVMFGFVLVITAMFFKISAAPFHMWSPDVYEGSATIVTTFFATLTKFTAVVALVQLCSGVIIGWKGIEKIFIFSAIFSLAVGSFGAIFQKNLKRLLAYSSIGNVGFILLGLAAFNKEGFTASIFYVIIYVITAVGSFGFLNLITDFDETKSGPKNNGQIEPQSNQADNNTDNNTDNISGDAKNEKIFALSALAGLAKTNPVMAFCLSVLIFSTIGIPPLAGFFSKFYILAAAISGGFLVTAILAVLFSVISAYYYLRIIKIMYFDAPQKIITLYQLANIKIIIFLAAFFNLTLIFFLKPMMSLLGNFLMF
jgi:NADH-quinone oxidoreductase subunit N